MPNHKSQKVAVKVTTASQKRNKRKGHKANKTLNVKVESAKSKRNAHSNRVSGIRVPAPLHGSYMSTSPMGAEGLVVRGREAISTVLSAVSFDSDKILITPHNTNVFPRAANIFRMYQKYRYVSLKWAYHPMVNFATVGIFGACFTADSLENLSGTSPTTMPQFFDMEGGAAGSVTTTMGGTIRFDKEFPWMDVLSIETDPTAVQVTLITGRDGATTGGITQGYITLEYEIQLKFPNIAIPLSLAYDSGATSATVSKERLVRQTSTAGDVTIVPFFPLHQGCRQDGRFVEVLNGAEGKKVAGEGDIALEDNVGYHVSLPRDRIYFVTIFGYFVTENDPGSVTLNNAYAHYKGSDGTWVDSAPSNISRYFTSGGSGLNWTVRFNVAFEYVPLGFDVQAFKLIISHANPCSYPKSLQINCHITAINESTSPPMEVKDDELQFRVESALRTLYRQDSLESKTYRRVYTDDDKDDQELVKVDRNIKSGEGLSDYIRDQSFLPNSRRSSVSSQKT